MPKTPSDRRRSIRPVLLPAWARSAGGWLALLGAAIAVATQLVQLFVLIWRELAG
jgi:hypothetical protein